MLENKPIWGHYREEGIYIFASSKAEISNFNELIQAYRASFRPPDQWETWEDYWNLRFDVFFLKIYFKIYKFKVHRVEKSSIGDFFICSCTEGIKKRPCIHAVVVMVREKILVFPPGVKNAGNQPLKGLRKKGGRPRKSEQGRPPKIQKQARFSMQ